MARSSAEKRQRLFDVTTCEIQKSLRRFSRSNALVWLENVEDGNERRGRTRFGRGENTTQDISRVKVNKTRGGTCRVTFDRFESILKSLRVRVWAVNNAPSLQRLRSREIEDAHERNKGRAISFARETAISLAKRVATIRCSIHFTR